MSDQKPIYLLAGGRRGGGSSLEAVFKAIFRDTGKAVPTIAYVGAANRDNKLFFLFIGREIKKTGPCKLTQAVIAAKKADLGKAREILRTADAVFMSGGDVEAGMRVIQEKNLSGFFRELYQDGKVFFGGSAGSIMLAKEWVRWRDPDDEATAEIFPCLGLAPVICDTHAEEDDWEELKAALALKEDKTLGYGIPSGGCLRVYPDGKVEALTTAVPRYVRKAEKVEKLEDLRPVVP